MGKMMKLRILVFAVCCSVGCVVAGFYQGYESAVYVGPVDKCPDHAFTQIKGRWYECRTKESIEKEVLGR